MYNNDKDKKNFIVAIVGESGSGKTSIVDRLIKKGYSSIDSYTTRKPRWIGEEGHEFVNGEFFNKFNKDDIVAHTHFDGNHYWASKQQLYNNELYVIDPSGINYLKERMVNEDMRVITIHIGINESDRILRMYERGDSRLKVESRVKNDEEKFKDLQFDYSIINEDIDRATSIIDNIIKTEIGWATICKIKFNNMFDRVLGIFK